MVLTSPVDGVVVEKNIVQGARFEPGETVLRLADLSSVWLVAKVPAAQAANITVGQAARFESVALPGDSFDGEVTFVQPVLDAQTRTVDVRIALPNPDGHLRPGLFGNVQLQDPSAQPVLTVPRSAVLDSGLRQIVLVQDGPGRFAPREVTLGRRGGDRVEVLEGLEAGEDVVVSANFLIDAESNLQAALQSMTGHGDHDAAPVEGHDAHGEHDHDPMDDSHLNGDHEMQGPEGHPDHESHEGHIDHGGHGDHTDHADHADHGPPGGQGNHDGHSDLGEH
jgi:Cu(I)/Ag(I) efflux system membrane fusion protein